MTLWALTILAVCTAIGVLLRLRYGNVFRRLLQAFEARSGITARTAILIAGGATILVWFAIALTADPESRGGLDELMEGFDLTPAESEEP